MAGLYFVLTLGGQTLHAEPARTAAPVAIVQDAKGVSNLRKHDLLNPGAQITLDGTDRVVIGYFRSCWQDSIVGGQLVIGNDSTQVTGGELYRQRVECDASGLDRIANTRPSKATDAPAQENKLPEPDIVLFGLSPVLLTPSDTGLLEIERLDAPAPTLRVHMYGPAIDLADSSIQLQPGGLYRLTFGTVALIARIDALAEPGPAPAIGRLMIFP